jgi:oligopeptide transport system ATP-binding protein
VMYLGRMMEVADARALTSAPRHPYTRALISSVPIPDPVQEKARPRPVLEGELPSPLRPPSGCVFRTRCPQAVTACAGDLPPEITVAPGHVVACPRHDAAAVAA